MRRILRFSNRNSSSFSSEYQALLTYATSQGITLPSADIQSKENALVIALKSSGIWDEADYIKNYSVDSSAFATLHLKDPTLHRSLLTGASPPALTTNKGFSASGVSGYIRTQFIPSTHGVNYTQNNNSIHFYSFTDVSGTSIDLGVTGTGGTPNITWVRTKNASNLTVFGNNSTTTTNKANTSSHGLISLYRIDSTTCELFLNGVSLGTGALTSSGVPNLEFYELANNFQGAASGFSTRLIGFVLIGSNAIDPLELTEIYTDYLNTIPVTL